MPGLGLWGRPPPHSHHAICQGCPGGQKRMCVEGNSREEARPPAASSLGSWWCKGPKADPHERPQQGEPLGASFHPHRKPPNVLQTLAPTYKEAGLQTKPPS